MNKRDRAANQIILTEITHGVAKLLFESTLAVADTERIVGWELSSGLWQNPCPEVLCGSQLR